MGKRFLGVGLLLVIIGGICFNSTSQPAIAPGESAGIPILMYHKVSPDPRSGGLGLRVPPRNFEIQMKLLSNLGYQSVNLDDVVAYLRDGGPLPDKPVVITFDDGYRDNFYWARPILQKYGFRATIFLVSDQIGKTNAWDESRGFPRNSLLREEEIRTMLGEGFQFGSHSKTHLRLTGLEESKAREQITGSRVALETTLGIPVNYFCYPYGKYNKAVVNIVRESGYTAALTTAQGQVRKGDNIFALKRIRITGQYNKRDFLRLLNDTGEKL